MTSVNFESCYALLFFLPYPILIWMRFWSFCWSSRNIETSQWTKNIIKKIQTSKSRLFFPTSVQIYFSLTVSSDSCRELPACHRCVQWITVRSTQCLIGHGVGRTGGWRINNETFEKHVKQINYFLSFCHRIIQKQ